MVERLMRNDENRSALHQRVHTLLHQRFGARIDGGSRLVQDHDGRIGDCRAGDRNELALPLREVGSLVAQHGIVSFGQPRNKVVRVGEFRRLNALFVRRVQFAVTDILHDSARKEVGILQHNAHGAAQICLFDLIDIDAVVTDLAVGNVVEAVQKVGDRSLTRARGADKGDLLPRLCVNADVVQYDLVRERIRNPRQRGGYPPSARYR